MCVYCLLLVCDTGPVDFVGGQLVAEFSGSSMAKVEVHTLQELPGLVEGTENFTAGIDNPFETSEGRIASGHPSIATVDITDCDGEDTEFA